MYRPEATAFAERADVNKESSGTVDPDAPWSLIHRIMRQAPEWAGRIDGLSGPKGKGEPPRCLIALPIRGGGRGSVLTPLQADWHDFKRAAFELGWKHPDGARLQNIVDKHLEGKTQTQIGRELARKVGRRAVRDALNEAFYWICSPEHGRFLSWEAWESGKGEGHE